MLPINSFTISSAEELEIKPTFANRLQVVHYENNSRLGSFVQDSEVIYFQVGENHPLWPYVDDNRYVEYDKENGFLFAYDLEEPVSSSYSEELRSNPSLYSSRLGTIQNSSKNNVNIFIVRKSEAQTALRNMIDSKVRVSLQLAQKVAKQKVLVSLDPIVFGGITWIRQMKTLKSNQLSIQFESLNLYNLLCPTFLSGTEEGLESFASFVGNWVVNSLSTTEVFWFNGLRVEVENNSSSSLKSTRSKTTGRSYSINGIGVRQDDIVDLFRLFLCCQTQEALTDLLTSTKTLPIAVRLVLNGEHPLLLPVPVEIQHQLKVGKETKVPIKFILSKDKQEIVALVGKKKLLVTNKRKFFYWCGSKVPLTLKKAQEFLGEEITVYATSDLSDLIRQWEEAFEKSRQLLLKTIQDTKSTINDGVIHVTGLSGNEYTIAVDPFAKTPPRCLMSDPHIPVKCNGRNVCIVCRGSNSMGYDRVTSTLIALSHDSQVVDSVTTLRGRGNL